MVGLEKSFTQVVVVGTIPCINFSSIIDIFHIQQTSEVRVNI